MIDLLATFIVFFAVIDPIGTVPVFIAVTSQLSDTARRHVAIQSVKQAQRFVTTHAAVSNLFNLGRHKVGAEHYRDFRVSAFEECGRAVA